MRMLAAFVLSLSVSAPAFAANPAANVVGHLATVIVENGSGNIPVEAFA